MEFSKSAVSGQGCTTGCLCLVGIYSLLALRLPSLISAGLSGLARELMTEFADSLPGIDEAKSFMQVMT